MRIVAVLAMLIGITPASAMTCAEFRSALPKAIAAGGNRVATPNFKIVPGARSQPDQGSIVGIDTALTCSEQGQLQGVDITAFIDSDDGEENFERHVRFNSLVGATLCVLEPKPAKACYAAAEQSQIKAIDNFLADKRRGEPNPSGFDMLIVRKPDLDPVIKATSGMIAFTVNLTE